jgi:hypothetical protein
LVSQREYVERDLVALGCRAPELADSALAGLALAMADRIDSGRGSPSECGKVLIMALEQLRELAPAKQEAPDGITNIADAREKRRAGVATASDLPGS